jgi:hypothetical protein
MIYFYNYYNDFDSCERWFFMCQKSDLKTPIVWKAGNVYRNHVKERQSVRIKSGKWNTTLRTHYSTVIQITQNIYNIKYSLDQEEFEDTKGLIRIRKRRKHKHKDQ